MKNSTFINDDDDGSKMKVFICTIPSTIIALTFANPLWMIKSLKSTDNFHSNHTAFYYAKKIYSDSNGIGGFTRGLSFGYLNSINGIITFTSYELLKDHYKIDNSTGYAICSAFSKTIAYLISYPLLALRIRHQVEAPTTTSLDVLRSVLKMPIRNIYYGLTPTLLQMVPKTTLMLLFYENILKLLN